MAGCLSGPKSEERKDIDFLRCFIEYKIIEDNNGIRLVKILGGINARTE